MEQRRGAGDCGRDDRRRLPPRQSVWWVHDYLVSQISSASCPRTGEPERTNLSGMAVDITRRTARGCPCWDEHPPHLGLVLDRAGSVSSWPFRLYSHVSKVNLPCRSDLCSFTVAIPPPAREDRTSPGLFPVPFISAFSRRRRWHESAFGGSSNCTRFPTEFSLREDEGTSTTGNANGHSHFESALKRAL